MEIQQKRIENLKNKIPTLLNNLNIAKTCDDMVTYFNSNKTRHAVGEVGETRGERY